MFTYILMHSNTLYHELASCVTENLKCVFANSCVLPTVEGVIYSYEGSNEILSHGTLID